MTGPGRGRRLAEWLLRHLDEDERDEILADLEELRDHRCRSGKRIFGSFAHWWDITHLAWASRAAERRAANRGRRPGWVAPSGLLESIVQDLRHAVRGLMRMPGVTLVALPTLALGIGATTALFSFADALILRPLPVREPDRLAALYHVSTEDPTYFSSFSYPDYLELRSVDVGFSDVAAYSDVDMRVGDGPDPEEIEGEIVSANYFAVLGVEPLLGRAFTADEDRDGADGVAILSQALWMRRFGGAPSVVGGNVTVNGRALTVVGVMPRSTPGADVHADPQLWLPLAMHDLVLPTFRVGELQLFYNRGTHWLGLFGRIRDGATLQGAAAALGALARRQAEGHPDTNGPWTITAVAMRNARVGSPGSSALPRLTALLAAVVTMVLLIACANVTNLLLAKAVVRRGEMAVRVAIGAGRGRLIRQVLTEALLLASAGGLGGSLLAVWAVRALPSLGVTSGLPGLDVRVDPRVLTFAVLATLVCGVASGLAPALRASAADVAHAGRNSDAGGSGRRSPLPRLLVAAQVALSLVLLLGAGLTLRSLRNLYTLPLGFDAADVRVAKIDLQAAFSPAASSRSTTEMYGALLGRVRSVPGVRDASLARIPPFSRRRMANDVFGETADGTRNRTNADMNVVDGSFFATMGIPLLAGRTFDSGDTGTSTEVAVVNQALASRFWPGQNAVGRRIWTWEREGPGRPAEVVGVVGDGRYYRSWRTGEPEERPFVFLPLAQHVDGDAYVHVRGARPGTPSEQALRHAILATDPPPQLSELKTVRAAQAESISVERTSAKLLGMFGVLAGTIAVIGIYGVVSFSVSRRTREMGLRMALGARAADVRRSVVAWSVGPILVGAGVGWGVALYLSRFVAGLLYGIGPRDPMTFAAVGAALVAVGLLASLVPARRATRVDPLVALRSE